MENKENLTIKNKEGYKNVCEMYGEKYNYNIDYALKSLKEEINDDNLFEKIQNNEKLNYIVTEYFKEMLRKNDPDSVYIQINNAKCSIDGLISCNKIKDYLIEKKDINYTIEQLVSEYKVCREKPIIFFPSEKYGINTSRSRIFTDKIDYTLFDIKKYFINGIKDCKLKTAFEKSNTNLWLNGFGSGEDVFKTFIDFYGLKGIFTDDNYDVYNLEKNNDEEPWEIITDYSSNYKWSIDYYENLKEKIKKFNKENS